MTKKEIENSTSAETAAGINKTIKGKTFTDVLDTEPFWPDLPKEQLPDLLNRTYKVFDARVIEDFETDFGTHDLALLALEDLDSGEKFTTACSGIVVVKKIKKVLAGKMLPLIGTITKEERYYDIT